MTPNLRSLWMTVGLVGRRRLPAVFRTGSSVRPSGYKEKAELFQGNDHSDHRHKSDDQGGEGAKPGSHRAMIRDVACGGLGSWDAITGFVRAPSCKSN
jgi:hypothetical protein